MAASSSSLSGLFSCSQKSSDILLFDNADHTQTAVSDDPIDPAWVLGEQQILPGEIMKFRVEIKSQTYDTFLGITSSTPEISESWKWKTSFGFSSGSRWIAGVHSKAEGIKWEPTVGDIIELTVDGVSHSLTAVNCTRSAERIEIQQQLPSDQIWYAHFNLQDLRDSITLLSVERVVSN